MINQIKTLLNIEVKLEEMKLENGTVITAEKFEEGSEIFIVTEDEKIALPVGEYSLEDGKVIVVSEEGVIAEMKEGKEVEAEESEEEVEAEEEVSEEVSEEETELYATKEELGKVIDMISEIKAMIDSKEEMSEGGSTLKSRTVKEEFSQDEALKQELSEPSAKPLKHNPEAKTETKKKMHFAKGNFGQTALDRVLNRLNK